MPGKCYLFGENKKQTQKTSELLQKLGKRHRNIFKVKEQYNNKNLLKGKQILKL